MPIHRKLRYISKYNKLVQLVAQIKYHVNVIYSLGGRHKYTHMPTLWTKTISRNKVHAGLWLVCTWFKNLCNIKLFEIIIMLMCHRIVVMELHLCSYVLHTYVAMCDCGLIFYVVYIHTYLIPCFVSIILLVYRCKQKTN